MATCILDLHCGTQSETDPREQKENGDYKTGFAETVENTGNETHPDSGTKHAINILLIYACTVFGASTFLFGFDNNVISPVVALKQFVDKYQGLNPTTGKYVFTARNQNLLFSLPLVGSIVGGLMASPANNHLGRKWSLIASYVLSLGGVFLQLFAPNLAAFVIGRAWNGVVMGIGNATAPLYLSEIVPVSMRGRSVTCINILSQIAGVVATIVVNGTHNMNSRASYMIPLGVHDLKVDDEIRVMKLCEDNERELSAEVRFWEIFNRQNLKRTLTAGSFFSLNQISGIILSTTYATVFLTDIGIAEPFTLTVIASCCTLAGTIFAPFIIDRGGRRPTALIGMTALFVIDIIAGALAFIPRLTAADAANLGAKTYLIFGGCMAFIIIAVYFFMPETRNRTFAEIDEMYDAHIPMWRWRNYETTTVAKDASQIIGEEAYEMSNL
ncbi:major facilitator superfamily domain-containing protein [Dipodascopsis uninucleata]